jgi:UDP-glucose 4-epimerase
VTGGAGFIGSHLVDRILEEGPRKLTVIDNLWLGRRENLRDAKRAFPALKLQVIDATSFPAMKAAMKTAAADVVFDLATIPLPASLSRPRWAAERIYRMATVISELARLEAFTTLIHCSSSEAYGTAIEAPMSEEHPLNVETPYAAAKAAGDLVVRSYWQTFGIDACTVRPFNNYGPRQNDRAHAAIIPKVLRGIQQGVVPTIAGDGEQTRDFMYVTDTAEALLRAFEVNDARHRVMNVGSGRETSVNDLIRRLCALTGFKEAPRYQPARIGDVRRHLADVALARKVLGFDPKVDLDEGLKRTVEWYLASGGG